MKKLIKEIYNLEKNDKTMLMLIFTTAGNMLFALVKFILAFTLPSMWFFVNAWFLTVLSISRFFLLRIMVKEEKSLMK